MAIRARLLAALLLAAPATPLVVRVRAPRMCSDATARGAPPDTSEAAAAISSLLSIDEADSILAAYDAGHRAAAARPDSEGMGGALTANAWSLTAEREPLAGAVRGDSTRTRQQIVRDYLDNLLAANGWDSEGPVYRDSMLPGLEPVELRVPRKSHAVRGGLGRRG